ncbi:MAG TPA: MarR family transcriptional regulator [Thermoleophilaceae bacterium]|nr:MarR family transcriptional regulator [Thermoleophilaceae bacterium]
MQASTSSAPADTAVLSRDLGLFLKRVLFANNREFFGAVQEAGISFTQLKCLGLLVEAGAPMSLSVFAEELALSPAAVSRAVDGLVQRGELKREEDPGDRRSKIVSLSAKGRTTYDRIIAVRLAGVRNFVEELEPEERDALGSALHPIIERLSL